MKPKLALIFIVIVLAPLAVLGWLGARFARVEREMVEHRFAEVATERLLEIDRGIARVLETRERDLFAPFNGAEPSPEALRASSEGSVIANQYFLVNEQNELVYPDPAGQLSRNEERFLQRTADLWLRGEIGAVAPENIAGKGGGQGRARGWHAWHWSDGLHLIYWSRDASGNIVGAELNRARLTADIIASLPDTAPEATGPARYVLADLEGTAIYQWGAAVAQSASAATIPLSPPLSSWRLEYHPVDAIPGGLGGGWMFNLAAGLALLVASIAVLSAYFYREHSREIRDAHQRVTFTNQVSHELKTPLTNIRLYADLLGNQVAQSDEKAQKYLDIIQSESQRLSRLIGNVLSFGRSRRKALTMHPVLAVPDDTIRSVCEHFEPVLSQRGIRVVVDGAANSPIEFDRDALEQILGNLLSNVEKYARGADEVRIETRLNGGPLTITVSDNGPGVPQRDRNSIFDPFYRASDKLTDGVAGAGIGLTIARELARQHGGDVTLEPSDSGARFKVVIGCVRVERETPA